MAGDDWKLIDADSIGHEVLETEDVKERIRAAFGEKPFDADGKINRRILGDMVFGCSKCIKKLNSIVHPPVLQRIEEQLRGTERNVILDAALIVETNLHRQRCDCLVFVDAPEEKRERWATEERKWDADRLKRIENSQIASSEKKKEADFVIPNNGSIDDLKAAVSRVKKSIQNQS
jgi:dephospho-CoA kinase